MVRLPPSWPVIRTTVNFVSRLVDARSQGRYAEAIALTTHELLENAIKYGGFGDVGLELRLAVMSNFEIRVSNQAVHSRVEILEKELKRIASSSPQQAYAHAMSRAGTLPAGSSMIGLSRIVHEGQVSLRREYTSGRVVVIAMGRP